MDRLHALISTHHTSLLALFRTFCILTAGTTLYGGLCALFLPSTLARNLGLLYSVSTPSHTKNSPAGSVKNKEITPALLLTLFAGREFALAAILAVLLYLDQLKALSLAMLALGLAGAADAVATWRYGAPGAWKLHFWATLCVVAFVVPLGLLLDAGL